jgi:hypothetical protein
MSSVRRELTKKHSSVDHDVRSFRRALCQQAQAAMLASYDTYCADSVLYSFSNVHINSLFQTETVERDEGLLNLKTKQKKCRKSSIPLRNKSALDDMRSVAQL